MLIAALPVFAQNEVVEIELLLAAKEREQKPERWTGEWAPAVWDSGA